jgi:hypothetical protein
MTTGLRGRRQNAGQELPRHAEHHLPEEAIKEDLDAIADGVSEAAAIPAKQRRKSSSTMTSSSAGSASTAAP